MTERLEKLIYQVNQNGSTVTSDTLSRIDFGGSSFGNSIDRIFMQNNQQLLVAGRFSYGTCPNSTAVPKNGFCRINLTYDEPCQAREVVPAAAGLVKLFQCSEWRPFQCHCEWICILLRQ
ncbi:MAG: hypothetical protein V9E88_09480 [Ferruginibacter sp.]